MKQSARAVSEHAEGEGGVDLSVTVTRFPAARQDMNGRTRKEWT